MEKEKKTHKEEGNRESGTIMRRILKRMQFGEEEKKERKHGSILRMLSLWVCRRCWRRGGGPGHCATIII